MRWFGRRKKIANDEALTEYGDRERPVRGKPFKDRPVKPHIKNAVSLMRGQLPVDQAVANFPNRRAVARKGEGVRYTTAGRLREAKFRVEYTPNEWNQVHVSVENLDAKREWTDDDSARFNECFGEPVWKEDDDE
ncbi:hypothetical protein ABZ260_10985 [Streptosporangium sp. NPDC006013]|uniref:hypothetical protein n=1 Tax=Streptosporangium sp. NPDC006013 TaxID=3155596 RepID=UPI0033AA7B24